MTDTDYVSAALHATVTVLSRRALMLLGLLSTFVLAIWAMAAPSWEHAGVAGGYAVMAWIFVNVPDIFRKA